MLPFLTAGNKKLDKIIAKMITTRKWSFHINNVLQSKKSCVSFSTNQIDVVNIIGIAKHFANQKYADLIFLRKLFFHALQQHVT